jgi:hypothetical protein
VRVTPFTANRLLSVQAAGSNPGTWGAGTANSLNEGVMQILDSNLGGITALSLTSVNVTLNQTQANNGLLRLTGTLTGAVVISPDVTVTMSGFFYFENLTTGNFSVTFSNSGGSVVLPQGRRGTMWIDTTYGPRVISSVGSGQTDIIPAGSVVTFYNTAAPTGYTIVSLNDYALKVVSSSGGVTSGSVAYSTLFGRTSVDNYALQIADIPAHAHAVTVTSNTIGNVPGGPTVVTNIATGSGTSTTSVGGGGNHTHGLDMRVLTASVILATRN